MIVVITSEAEADLENIGDLIAADNPRRAVTFISELIEACEKLANFPVDILSYLAMRRAASVGGCLVSI